MSQTSDSCSTGKPTETWNSSFNAAVYCMQASLRTWNISNSGYHTLRTLVFSQPPQISSWHDHCFQRLLWPYRMCSANLRLATSQPLTHIFENHPQGYLWHFSDECHSMFEALRKAFTTAPALMHCTPDTQNSQHLQLHIHLSPFDHNSEWCLHQLHSTSRPHSTPEHNYPPHTWSTWSLMTRIVILFTDSILHVNKHLWTQCTQ